MSCIRWGSTCFTSQLCNANQAGSCNSHPLALCTPCCQAGLPPNTRATAKQFTSDAAEGTKDTHAHTYTCRSYMGKIIAAALAPQSNSHQELQRARKKYTRAHTHTHSHTRVRTWTQKLHGQNERVGFRSCTEKKGRGHHSDMELALPIRVAKKLHGKKEFARGTMIS